MSKILSFDKIHGLGNDFLVIQADHLTDLSVAQAIGLCDRHFGVGGDGVLLVLPPRTPDSRATMHVINADGSQPEMCGNGLRCVVLYLCRQAGEFEGEFIVDTGAGPLLCKLEKLPTEGANNSTLSPSGPVEALIGTEIGTGTILESRVTEFQGNDLEFQRVSTGNPHAICFRDSMTDADLDRLGPALSASIEGGSNIEIATLRTRVNIDLSVWERGVGRTLACGTGAAATAIAAVESGRSPAGQPITLNLPGGPLQVTVSADLTAYLQGPARWVFAGKTEI